MRRTLPLAVLATLFAVAPMAQTGAPETTADPRADPSQPFDQTADKLRTDPTGITTGTVETNRMSNAQVVEDPTLGNLPNIPQGRGTVTVGNPDFQSLDRDVRAAGTDPNAGRYGQERDVIRRDYEALDANAAMEARMNVTRRYDDLSASLSSSRMSNASRNEYFQMGNDRLTMYDRDIQSARMDYMNAPGDMKAEQAQKLIHLRRQRDMYRNDLYDVRGAGRSGFDAARRMASPNLSRYDTDFRNARRDMMMRGSMGAPAPGSQPMNGGMRN